MSPRQAAFYLCCAALVVGNLAVPQLCHLAAMGGKTWLPIYFFTLVGGWCFGWRVGLLTALCSPLLNWALFGMPPTGTLPVILVKSVLLAGFAAVFAARVRGLAGLFVGVLATVVCYQVFGGFFEAGLKGFAAALGDVRVGWPGLLVQVFGGSAFVWLLCGLRGKQDA